MINEILSSDIGIGGESEFVVDSAVDYVPVTVPGVAGLDFYNGNNKAVFDAGDNILLTGAIVNIPYGFGQAIGKAYLGIVWKTQSGGSIIIPELASNSILVLPNICSTLEFPPSGLYIPCPKTEPVSLNLTNIVLNVSMVNVPAQLNGKTIKVQFHLRVNHTKPLSIFP